MFSNTDIKLTIMKAREKGKNYEIKLMNELKDWFPDVKTSRSESRNRDDLGADFVNTHPFAIQAKATEKSPSYSVLLKDMQKNLPGEIPIIIRKQNNKPETVTMLKEDFYALVFPFKVE